MKQLLKDTLFTFFTTIFLLIISVIMLKGYINIYEDTMLYIFWAITILAGMYITTLLVYTKRLNNNKIRCIECNKRTVFSDGEYLKCSNCKIAWVKHDKKIINTNC